MPRFDGESLVVTFDMLELATPFYCLFGGGIDMTGGLVEVEGGGTHGSSLSMVFWLRRCAIEPQLQIQHLHY